MIRLIGNCCIAITAIARTNQNPKQKWGREAPPPPHFCFGVIKPLIAIKANIFVETFANQHSQQDPKTRIWRKEPNFSFWLDIVIF